MSYMFSVCEREKGVGVGCSCVPEYQGKLALYMITLVDQLIIN